MLNNTSTILAYANDELGTPCTIEAKKKCCEKYKKKKGKHCKKCPKIKAMLEHLAKAERLMPDASLQ